MAIDVTAPANRFTVTVRPSALPGPAGQSGNRTVQLPGGGVFASFSPVALIAGKVVLADSANPAHEGRVIGISETAGAVDAAVTVRTADLLTNAAWSWTPGPIYLGPSGALTQAPPGGGILVRLGEAINATQMLVMVTDLIDPTTLVASPDIEVPFGFGDATPKAIATAKAGKLVLYAAIVITTPFNGVGAALALGDAADPERLMAAAVNDPALAAEFAATPLLSFSTDTPVILTISPGAGATAGAGLVLLNLQT